MGHLDRPHPLGTSRVRNGPPTFHRGALFGRLPRRCLSGSSREPGTDGSILPDARGGHSVHHQPAANERSRPRCLRQSRRGGPPFALWWRLLRLLHARRRPRGPCHRDRTQAVRRGSAHPHHFRCRRHRHYLEWRSARIRRPHRRSRRPPHPCVCTGLAEPLRGRRKRVGLRGLCRQNDATKKFRVKFRVLKESAGRACGNAGPARLGLRAVVYYAYCMRAFIGTRTGRRSTSARSLGTDLGSSGRFSRLLPPPLLTWLRVRLRSNGLRQQSLEVPFRLIGFALCPNTRVAEESPVPTPGMWRVLGIKWGGGGTEGEVVPRPCFIAYVLAWTCSGSRPRARGPSALPRLSSRPRGSRWHASRS